ncbi:MAG: SOUL family heme-binding protein [Bacteroidota bacterium]
MKAKHLILIILFTMAASGSKAQTEQQSYTLVHQFPGFEIRYYPEAVLARVYTTARSYREMTSPAFNALAGYIFGGNATGQKIAMTAPVHIDLHENGSSMSFVMPAEYDMEDLPQPNNQSIQLERSQAGYYAVITFGGFASDDKIQRESEKLRELLRKNNFEWDGNFRFLGYNSPYKLWNRRNEVVVRVNWE